MLLKPILKQTPDGAKILVEDLVETLRQAMSLTATGVCVIATDGPGGRAGATISSFSSLSMAPPSVMANLHRDSRTLAAIVANGAFGVSVLAQRHQEIAKNFARADATAQEAFAHGDWREVSAGAIVTDDAVVRLGCRLARCFEYGAAVIVVGDVVTVSSQAGPPLLYNARSFCALERSPVQFDQKAS